MGRKSAATLEAEAQRTMTCVLETRLGNYVTSLSLGLQDTPHESIVWGDRVFNYFGVAKKYVDETGDTVVSYVYRERQTRWIRLV